MHGMLDPSSLARQVANAMAGCCCFAVIADCLHMPDPEESLAHYRKYPGSGVRTLRLVLLAEASLKLSAAAKSVAAVCGRNLESPEQ